MKNLLNESKLLERLESVDQSIEYLADTLDKLRDERSDFHGWTIADSLGYIAEALMELKEKKDES